MTTTSRKSASATTSRSIISRITSPFSNKTRNFSDFHIQTDEPYRQYNPGDEVKGSVHLTVHKPVRITHIVICLHGYVRVFKNAIAPGEGISTDSGFLAVGRGRRGTEYFGNGFASLFQDELVLCGEGRLDVGAYVFKFTVEFPSRGIPSSIDFERGTISYMLTSTLTRPTTIAPISTCDRKIHLTETIDVAPLRNPKPRVITLEPIPKRSRHKNNLKKPATLSTVLTAVQPTTGVSGVIDEVRPGSPEPIAALSRDEPAKSPVPSDVSSGSHVSSSNFSVHIGTQSVHNKNDAGSDLRGSVTSIVSRTITATTELLRGGCLPGDLLPVIINIEHTKPIKSLQGVIVTLYRIGRIDTHPVIPLGPSKTDKAPVYEDYYPRSRTGLGGLSLSSAGSSHVYRMDLAQTFAPLIVDPISLNAVVKTSVRVPDNVFPSISSTPGAMISFNYYVEVVMDLRGKLANQDRLLPRLGRTNALPSTEHVNPVDARRDAIEGSILLNGSNIEETDQIRREKSVVACVFEVIVGTRDSERNRTRWTEDGQSKYSALKPHNSRIFEPRGLDPPSIMDESQTQAHSWQKGLDEVEQQRHNSDDQQGWQQNHSRFPATVTPPQLAEPLNEKSRLKLAEERLLPSSPPLNDESTPAAPSLNTPTAPTTLELQANFRSHTVGLSSAPSQSLAESLSTRDHEAGRSLEDALLANEQDDKQELERARLLMEASAPEDSSSQDESQSNPACHSDRLSPSAPVLNRYEEYEGNHLWGSTANPLPSSGSRNLHGATENLPRYRR